MPVVIVCGKGMGRGREYRGSCQRDSGWIIKMEDYSARVK